MAFCKEYNAATQDKVGTVIPVEITVYEVRLLVTLVSSNHLCRNSERTEMITRSKVIFRLLIWLEQ